MRARKQICAAIMKVVYPEFVRPRGLEQHHFIDSQSLYAADCERQSHRECHSINAMYAGLHVAGQD